VRCKFLRRDGRGQRVSRTVTGGQYFVRPPRLAKRRPLGAILARRNHSASRIDVDAASDYWQQILAPGGCEADVSNVGYVANLADGRQLVLPIRTLADGRHGLASLIINQASFAVQDALATDLAQRIESFEPDVVVGLPTLGLTLASAVARKLGHARYVPLGTSRKFWYRDDLSAPLSSVTTPDQEKRLFVDPRMLPLLEGRRVALVDDVISTGASMAAGLALMTRIGVDPEVIGVAMLQSSRWRHALEPALQDKIVTVISTPLLEMGPDGAWKVC
jgi:adenine/guanine phosphoribosyltransferase-like PRPP-binding protein